LKLLLHLFLLKWIIKYTPAVTKVEECTKADTSVGTAIAKSNHTEKGIWALLVMAANSLLIILLIPTQP